MPGRFGSRRRRGRRDPAPRAATNDATTVKSLGRNEMRHTAVRAAAVVMALRGSAWRAPLSRIAGPRESRRHGHLGVRSPDRGGRRHAPGHLQAGRGEADGPLLVGRARRGGFAGCIKELVIEFTVAASVQGNAITLTFTGTVEDANSMKGKVSFSGLGEGTFTAKRK